MKRLSRNDAGFTLLELIAVLGIIALMTVMVLGGFGGIQNAFQRNYGADMVTRSLQLARQQAVVEGVEVYFWPTGVDKFVLCRRGGVVSAVFGSSAQRTPCGMDAIQGPFVRDDYAEFPSVSQYATSVDEEILQAATEALKERYSDYIVFNLTQCKQSAMTFPPFYSDDPVDCGALLFGVKSASTFKVGDIYGFVFMPEQTLPDGWLFQGSYSKTTGEFISSFSTGKGLVKFFPDGSIEGEKLTLERLTASGEVAQQVEIEVKPDGKVTVSYE